MAAGAADRVARARREVEREIALKRFSAPDDRAVAASAEKIVADPLLSHAARPPQRRGYPEFIDEGGGAGEARSGWNGLVLKGRRLGVLKLHVENALVASK